MAGTLFVSPPSPLPSQSFPSFTFKCPFPFSPHLLHSSIVPASLPNHRHFRSRFICSVFSSSPISSGKTTLDPEDNNMDADTKKVLIRGGDQVTSVLEEMIKLLQDMELDEASEAVAVEIAAQGVIGKRVDEMESGFIMALDYMIQLAEKDNDDKVTDEMLD